MKVYEIWTEGYQATGEHGKAMLMGIVKAKDFKSACIKHFGDDECFDKDKLKYWACRLFPTEKEARKFCG